MSETRILIRLRVYFSRNWEFGSALSKFLNFGGGGVERPAPSVRHVRPHICLSLGRYVPYLVLNDTRLVKKVVRLSNSVT
jgi:hypothetical protein